MADEKLKYRLSFFRSPETILLYWDFFPVEYIDKIPENYLYNTRSINLETGEICEKTYILVIPVKKFRKKETVLNFSDTVDLGLDDY